MNNVDVRIEYQGLPDSIIKKIGSSAKQLNIEFVSVPQTKSQELFHIVILITMPFLNKIVSGIADSIGDDIWELIKKLFGGNKRGKNKKRSMKLSFRQKAFPQKITIHFEAIDSRIAACYLKMLDSVLPLVAKRMKKEKLVSAIISSEENKNDNFIIVHAKQQNGKIIRLFSLQVD